MKIYAVTLALVLCTMITVNASMTDGTVSIIADSLVSTTSAGTDTIHNKLRTYLTGQGAAAYPDMELTNGTINTGGFGGGRLANYMTAYDGYDGIHNSDPACLWGDSGSGYARNTCPEHEYSLVMTGHNDASAAAPEIALEGWSLNMIVEMYRDYMLEKRALGVKVIYVTMPIMKHRSTGLYAWEQYIPPSLQSFYAQMRIVCAEEHIVIIDLDTHFRENFAAYAVSGEPAVTTYDEWSDHPSITPSTDKTHYAVLAHDHIGDKLVALLPAALALADWYAQEWEFGNIELGGGFEF